MLLKLPLFRTSLNISNKKAGGHGPHPPRPRLFYFCAFLCVLASFYNLYRSSTMRSTSSSLGMVSR